MYVLKYFFEHGWVGYTTLIQMSKIKFITIFIVSILCIYSIFHMAYMELNAHTWDVIFFNYSFASNSISSIAQPQGDNTSFSPYSNTAISFHFVCSSNWMSQSYMKRRAFTSKLMWMAHSHNNHMAYNKNWYRSKLNWLYGWLAFYVYFTKTFIFLHYDTATYSWFPLAAWKFIEALR